MNTTKKCLSIMAAGLLLCVSGNIFTMNIDTGGIGGAKIPTYKVQPITRIDRPTFRKVPKKLNGELEWLLPMLSEAKRAAERIEGTFMMQYNLGSISEYIISLREAFEGQNAVRMTVTRDNLRENLSILLQNINVTLQEETELQKEDKEPASQYQLWFTNIRYLADQINKVQTELTNVMP